METLLDRGIEEQVFEPPQLGYVLFLPGLPGGGSKIYDRSPYGNIGTITGATWTKLPSGLWCLSFDGVDDYIDCGSVNSLAITRSLTIICWVKLTVALASQPDTAPTIISRQASGPTNRNYSCIIDKAADTFLFLGRNTAGDAYIFQVTLASISSYLDDLDWHQIAAVWDRDNTSAYIYIDGTNEATVTGQTDGDLYTSTGSLSVGRGTGVGDTFINGLESNIFLYNRALNALEIQNHFNQGKHLFGVW